MEKNVGKRSIFEQLEVKEDQSISENIENVKVRYKYFRIIYYMRKKDHATYAIKDMYMDRLEDMLYVWEVHYMDTLNDLARDSHNEGIAKHTMATFNKLRGISPKRGGRYDVVEDAIHDVNNIQDVLIHMGFRL